MRRRGAVNFTRRGRHLQRWKWGVCNKKKKNRLQRNKLGALGKGGGGGEGAVKRKCFGKRGKGRAKKDGSFTSTRARIRPCRSGKKKKGSGFAELRKIKKKARGKGRVGLRAAGEGKDGGRDRQKQGGAEGGHKEDYDREQYDSGADTGKVSVAEARGVTER